MSDSGAIVPDSAGQDLSGSDSSLPLWHKPEVSRISIASSDGGRSRLRPTTSDDLRVS